MTQYSQQYQLTANPKELSIYWDFAGAITLDTPTPQPFKAITVTTGGLVMWKNLDGNVQSFYCGIPGQLYPIRGIEIITGTTATGIYWAGGI